MNQNPKKESPMKNVALIFSLFFLLTIISQAQTNTFGGIYFPQGLASFADTVVSYEPTFGGGALPAVESARNPALALGPPDYTPEDNVKDVTLGKGGRLTLKFENNFLTGSGDSTPDLHIFEVGPQVEDTFVEISKDGTNWFDVGKVFGSTDSVDIDAYGFGTNDLFQYVRLRDDPNEGSHSANYPGADIDAVGAVQAVKAAHRPVIDLEVAIVLKFQSFIGSRYQVQYSTDMALWTDIGDPIIGTGERLIRAFDTTSGRSYRAISLP